VVGGWDEWVGRMEGGWNGEMDSVWDGFGFSLGRMENIKVATLLQGTRLG